MSPEMRLPYNDDRALCWLKRQLEGEAILTALRAAGRSGGLEPVPQEREPAAA
jgi:hypothetical protein